MSEEWKSRVQRLADFWFWGYMIRKFQGAPLKPDHILVFCQASFLMTLSQVEFLTLAPGTPWTHGASWKGSKDPSLPQGTLGSVAPGRSCSCSPGDCSLPLGGQTWAPPALLLHKVNISPEDLKRDN